MILLFSFCLYKNSKMIFFWTELLPFPLQMREAWQPGAHALYDHTQWELELNGSGPLRLRMGPRV